VVSVWEREAKAAVGLSRRGGSKEPAAGQSGQEAMVNIRAALGKGRFLQKDQRGSLGGKGEAAHNGRDHRAGHLIESHGTTGGERTEAD